MLNQIYRLKSLYRKLILIFFDVLVITTSLKFLFLILKNLGIYEQIIIKLDWLLFLLPFLSVFIYLLIGQYKGITRYLSSIDFYRFLFSNIIVNILILAIAVIFSLYLPPISLIILTWAAVTFSNITLRIFLRDIIRNYNSINEIHSNIENLVIYGAGVAGAQLANSLQQDKKNVIKFFIDDKPELWGRSIQGIAIKSFTTLETMKDEIDKILIAIPSLNKRRLRDLVKRLEYLGIPVMQIPSFNDLVTGREKISSLRPIPIERLLEREEVQVNKHVLEIDIKNKVICITGAGGSIGSELSLQLCLLNPKELILIDNSESSLYNIHQNLLVKNKQNIKIIPVLGDCCNYNFIDNLFSKYNIDKVYHAAAYKHVPMVEANPIQGVLNNILATQSICKSSIKNSIDQVVLVSSDKAVRPSSVMGVSKRLSEIILQAYNSECSQKQSINDLKVKTKFSMVRFGNVLASSGSVVPLFQKQIAEGGPITLTHKDITRYFMTISEAAQLVLHSSVLAQGGELFLLDMGEPMKVMDLAYKMVNFSGLQIKDESNPNGDIEIVETGIREGEKLFEELLIDNSSFKTSHPLIYKANEYFIEPTVLWKKLDFLYEALEKHDENMTYKILSELVPEWENKKNEPSKNNNK
tara:strand:- start:8513 stop:10429 length:1917 start_codon:yes stop_codon:yes gene_type:complete